MRRSWILGALVVAALAGASACGGASAEEPAAAPATATPPATGEPLPATGAVEPAPAEPAAAGLADGRYFGYVRSVDTSGSPASVEFDPAEFLVGEAALEAALEDDPVFGADAFAGDVYIRNPDEDTVELPVSTRVVVTRVQCPAACDEGLPGDFAGLAASFALEEPVGLDAAYRGAFTQYWLTIEDGAVSRIDEQYLP